MYPQRWNRKDGRMVYAGLSLAVCQLELLVHLDRAAPPKDHVWIRIEVPDGVPLEEIDRDEIRGWAWSDCAASRRYGSQWIEEARTVGLIVPSRAASDGQNLLLNPLHPDFAQITSSVRRMRWDQRLFRNR
jgi:RES domain-containing protein